MYDVHCRSHNIKKWYLYLHREYFDYYHNYNNSKLWTMMDLPPYYVGHSNIVWRKIYPRTPIFMPNIYKNYAFLLFINQIALYVFSIYIKAEVYIFYYVL